MITLQGVMIGQHLSSKIKAIRCSKAKEGHKNLKLKKRDSHSFIDSASKKYISSTLKNNLTLTICKTPIFFHIFFSILGLGTRSRKIKVLCYNFCSYGLTAPYGQVEVMGPSMTSSQI